MATIIALVLVALSPTRADDISQQYPDPAQVAADYPDDAERYVALNLLWDSLREKSPTDPAAHDKRIAYYQAASSVQARYAAARDQSATDFATRTERLNADRAFKQSILAKYQLLNIAAAPPSPVNGDVTDAMIEAQFWRASPFLFGTLAVMFVLTRIIVRRSPGCPTVKLPRPAAVGHLPELPEDLRIVKLPTLRYTVQIMSGLVVDKESAIHTAWQSTTTPTQTYSIGNEVHIIPGQTTTTSHSTKVDTIWVRGTNGVESAWTFSGTNFQTRAGHLISVVAPQMRDGALPFILACNHSTQQMEVISCAVHGGRGRWAWLLGSIVGSVGFAIWLGIMLSLQPEQDPLNRALGPLVWWIMALVPAIFIAAIMVVRAKSVIFKKRNARFSTRYFPAFRNFLFQLTPSLQQHFSARPRSHPS